MEDVRALRLSWGSDVSHAFVEIASSAVASVEGPTNGRKARLSLFRPLVAVAYRYNEAYVNSPKRLDP